MEATNRTDDVPGGFAVWDGQSDDAADSGADNLERVHQCAACWWEPGGEPHDDDSCEYEPDLPAERTGEYAILDWPHYEWMHECRFSGDAGDDGDDQRWVLAEYTIKPGAEEGFYDNLCEPTTIAECLKLAEEIDIGRMIGD